MELFSGRCCWCWRCFSPAARPSDISRTSRREPAQPGQALRRGLRLQNLRLSASPSYFPNRDNASLLCTGLLHWPADEGAGDQIHANPDCDQASPRAEQRLDFGVGLFFLVRPVLRPNTFKCRFEAIKDVTEQVRSNFCVVGCGMRRVLVPG